MLRGPQGTLYGASSLGGVLKFVTNRAVDRRHRSARPGRARDRRRRRNGLFGQRRGQRPAGRHARRSARRASTARTAASSIRSARELPGTVSRIVDKNINDSRKLWRPRVAAVQAQRPVSVRLSGDRPEYRGDAPSIVEADPVTLETALRPPQPVAVRAAIHRHQLPRLQRDRRLSGFGFADLTSSTSYSTQKQTCRAPITPTPSAPLLGTSPTILSCEPGSATQEVHPGSAACLGRARLVRMAGRRLLHQGERADRPGPGRV